MNCAPTISAEDFKNIHNAKCDLVGILKSLDGIIHPSLQNRLEIVVEKLNEGLKSAYEQDDAAFSAAENHIASVERELGGMKSVWSMFEVKDLRAPHPWKNHRTISYQGWGDVEVKVAIPGPLWSDLWLAAEQAIEKSGDDHHIFIEGFTPSPSNATELHLSTGS